ncbi:RNA-directed DNA polymerase, eukaryota, reverse transcriptase zinc-binding domain protein [Tanacetum coccineum]
MGDDKVLNSKNAVGNEAEVEVVQETVLDDAVLGNNQDDDANLVHPTDKSEDSFGLYKLLKISQEVVRELMVFDSGCLRMLLKSIRAVGRSLSMNYMSLNIQGLAHKTKKDWVRELCIHNKVNFLALQETKMESMDNSCVRKCWGNMVYDHAFSDAVDHRPILSVGRTSLIMVHYTIRSLTIGSDMDGFCKIVEIHEEQPKKNVKVQFKKDLEAVNQIIDSGSRASFGFLIKVDALMMHHYSHSFFSSLTLIYLMHDLEAEVSKDEVKRAVWECGTDKAPGPDGFTFGFFRHFWYLVEKDVIDAVVIFFRILKVLESIRSHFFNGHDISSKKVSWVNWNKVIASKIKVVIKAIHGVDGNLGSNSKGGMKSCWSSIVTEVNALANKGIDLMQFLRIKMGNGDSIRLWEDPWHEGGILKLRYPRVYALEMCKSITIGGKLAHPNLSDSFRRYPRGGAEFSQFGEFSALMHQVIRAPMADRWMWTRNSSGEFTVASVRQFIDDKICIGRDHKTTWIRFIPNKVNIHAWKVMLNALPTKFNISRRGIQIDSIICVNCGIGVETTNHLFCTWNWHES